VHFWSGAPVVLSGVGGTFSVVAANSWMNAPGGITVRDGAVVDVDVWQVFFNDAFWYEALHMLLAAYVVAGFTVAGVYAVGMLRGRRDRYHRVGLLLPLTVGAVAIPLQIFMGDVIARYVFTAEPAKFAAIEALPDTRTHAPETLGGILVDGKVRGGLPIPDGASLLSGFSPDTRVKGLDAIPAAVRPRDDLVSVVHLSFDVMVGTGFALLALALWFVLLWWRSRVAEPGRWFLRAVAVSGVVSIVSLESGWVVTEVGRQPWTVVGLLLTRDAVQTSGNLWPLFAGALLIYAGVTVGAIYALRALRRRWARGEATSVPYGPQPEPEREPEPAP
jgi:cytochrome d ubiquinol oxidase subunit I